MKRTPKYSVLYAMSYNHCLPTFRRNILLSFAVFKCPIFFVLQDLEDISKYFIRNIGNFLIFVTAYYSCRPGSL